MPVSLWETRRSASLAEALHEPVFKQENCVTRWSVVVPVYNEKDFLPETLRSLAAQVVDFELVIVDNGSTDGGIEAARRLVSELGINAQFFSEPTPGQVHALKCGIAAAKGELVAICDADTYYPPEYLAAAQALFDRGGRECVATAAVLLPAGARGAKRRLAEWHRLGAMRLLSRQNHTSGAAQCFRRDVLCRVGGYDAAIWPYVLKDHELMHRVLREGRQAWSRELWCVTSDRRASRKAVRWTLGERLAYHLVPFGLKTRFFHGFLASRFRKRDLGDTVLRQRAWEGRSTSRTAATVAILGGVFMMSLPAETSPLTASVPVPPREERGRDQADCRRPEPGPAFLFEVRGLKDRTGRLQLELYPARDKDFLAPDKQLIAEGKPFKRVWANVPARGNPVICVRAPAPGRYALVVLHDRDSNGKFGYLRDGVAFPGDPSILRSKPPAQKASLSVSNGVVVRQTVTMQYLRGLRFKPLG